MVPRHPWHGRARPETMGCFQPPLFSIHQVQGICPIKLGERAVSKKRFVTQRPLLTPSWRKSRVGATKCNLSLKLLPCIASSL